MILLACAVPVPAEDRAESQGLVYDYDHAFSLHWEPKYSAGFTHFDHFNPDAPRGGEIRVPILGTWDSFNSFIDRGRQAAGMSFLSPRDNLYYDRLLTSAADEPSSQYGRLAEGIKVADDASFIAFKLREFATWHDGRPITVDDVMFSFEQYKENGSAWLKTMIADVDRIEKIGPWEVQYVMKQGITPNPSLTSAIGAMPVIPKHYWESRDLSKTTIEVPLGSGPYRIKEFRLGRYVVYERDDNYWGNDIPTMKGRFNFKEIKYDYFRDTQVRLEALRGHLVDVYEDTSAKNWNVEYDFPAADAGYFKKRMFKSTSPQGLSWPIFWNLRKERFQDIRVREALLLLYDFEFINRVLNYDFYERGRSLFHGAREMEQAGIPTGKELELLEPFRDQLPPRMFAEPYQPPVNDGYGIEREHVERAIELFAEAGWIIRDKKLVNAETGEIFKIDFIFVAHTLSRSVLPYIDQLNRIGIETSVRVPEVSNWLYRMQTSNFDASAAHMYPYRTPGIALRNHFGSASAELGFGVNWGYVKHPAIDAMAEQVIAARSLETFLAAINAADRIIMSEYYFIPVSANAGSPMVYWDKFDWVDVGPLERVPHLDGWWYNEEKAARIRAGLADSEAQEAQE
ncbi:MAG: extracellular solute-binding protein [Pseudomonadales bacterium]